VAHAIVLLERIDVEDGLRQMEAAVENRQTVEDVVSELVKDVHSARAAARKGTPPAFNTEDIT
jgi:hypothetical protein